LIILGIVISVFANSEKVRLELLAGLIDSDGYYDKNCGGYEITVKEKKLAEDIKFLCDTLGFRVSLIEKLVNYKDEKRKYYRIRFFGDVNKIPVKIKRKKAKEWTCNRDWQLTGIKVEFDKIDEYFGFEIDGNRLFLLEDCTVTHNTALALNLGLNVLKQNKGVAIFSLEMPAEQLMLRMLSSAGRIPLQDLRRGNLDDNEWSKLTAVADELSSKPLFVDDEGNVNIHTIRAKLRKLKMQNPNLSLAIVDYLQLISSDQRERHLAIAEISRSLKLLARELQIPIIALSQLNRSLESRPNKRPMLSDLRESGAIEQDADIIMFIYRDDVYKAMEAKQKQKEALEKGKAAQIDFQEKEVEDAEIIIGKQRNGPTGTVEMLFHKKYVLFTDKVSEVQEIQMSEAQIEIPPI
jgi:replicative DNA helicase